jgi:hypothetical protein
MNIFTFECESCMPCQQPDWQSSLISLLLPCHSWQLHDSAVEMKRRDFLAGNWAPYLERALACKPSYNEPTNGAEVVAKHLIAAMVRGWKWSGYCGVTQGGLHAL